MSGGITIKSNFKGLEDLQKNLKKQLVVKVGVLGADSARSDDSTGMTNAEIGARHEFGVISEHLPRRSFLWDMILLKRKQLAEDAGKIAKKQIAEDGGILKIMKGIGIAAEKIVIKSFDTEGYGTWAPLSESRKKEKAEQNLPAEILMATTQLSKSITSQIGGKND